MLYNYKNIDEKMIIVNKKEFNKCQHGEVFTVGVFKKKKSDKPTLRELVEQLFVEVRNINKRLDQNGLKPLIE